MIRGRKNRFSASSQNPITEKSIFGHFEVIFLNVIFFSRARWLFPVSTTKEEYVDEKMSSLAGLKSYSISRKSTDFGYLGPPSKSIFSAYRQNFEKFSVIFLERLLRALC